MAKTPNRENTRVVGVRVPHDLYAKITEQAATEHRPVSNLIVKLLLEIYGDTPRANGAHKKPVAVKQAAA